MRFYCGKSKRTTVLPTKTAVVIERKRKSLFPQKAKCNCGMWQDVVPDGYVDKITCASAEKAHLQSKQLTKNAKCCLQFYHKKNGRVIEQRMTKQERENHKKTQKSIYALTNKTICTTVKMTVGATNGNER